MIYEYLCEQCKVVSNISKSMKEDIPKNIPCECGGTANRVWGGAIKIPEHMKAVSEICGGDSYSSLDNLKSRFKHSHPSGRDTKIYY